MNATQKKQVQTAMDTIFPDQSEVWFVAAAPTSPVKDEKVNIEWLSNAADKPTLGLALVKIAATLAPSPNVKPQ